jgi:hypothetical protein
VGTIPDPDLELEAELRRAAALFDPDSERRRQFAIDAYTLRTLGAELAELVFDSVDHEAELVRGGDQPRLLTFRSGALTIDVEVIGTGRDRRVVGQLVPAQPARIDIRGTQRTVPVDVDDLGRFAAAVPGRGPLSLRCELPGPPPATIVSEWVA